MVVVVSFLVVLQEDIRKFFVYLLVGQVGYIFFVFGFGMGFGFVGGFFYVFSYVVFKGFFWFVIVVIIFQIGKIQFKDFGGLVEKMFFIFVMGFIVVFSFVGILLMVGFVSKWLIYEVVISVYMFFVVGVIFFGSVLVFVYVVRFFYVVWFGQRFSDFEDVKEVLLLFFIVMVILVILNIVFGIVLGFVMNYFNKVFGGEVVGGNYYKFVIQIGIYNVLIVVFLFVVGLVIVGFIYFYGVKVRRILVINIYQLGNFVIEEFNFSIRRNFYFLFKEVLVFWFRYSFDKFYERIVQFSEDFVDILREGFYNGNVQVYLWYLVIVFVILVFWGVL